MIPGARDLRVRRGDTLALDGVTIDLEPGRVHGVVGGDGAGKSTLLGVLAGLGLDHDGEVRVPAADRIGYVPADGGVFSDLSVDENVEFLAQVQGLRDWRPRADDLLERAAVAPFGRRLAGHLSGGQRRKLALCLALLHRPDLVVLDEVTTGVDPVSRMELWRLVTAAAADAAAVVVATTYLDEAERMGWVLLLHDGRTLAAGPPAEIVARLPGVVRRLDVPTDPPRAWRAGRHWHQWVPDDRSGTADEVASLEDTAIALELAGSPGAAGDGEPSEPAARHRTDRVRRPARTPAGSPAHGPGRRRGPVLAAHDVTRTFGSFTAVDRMELEVHPGEIVGLLGANGAGKTTLIRMLLGLLTPTAGAIRLFGRPHGREQRRRIGYVPQGLGLYRDLTAAENLGFRAAVFGVERAGDVDDAPTASGSLVGDQPLGLRRRTAFRAATQHDPELAVLDEPTSGVSPLSRSRLWDLVHRRAEAGAGVLVSTHYMDEAVQADRLVVMSRGRLVAAGSSAEVIGDREVVEVETRDWGDAVAVLDRRGRSLRLAGRTIRALDEQPAALLEELDRHGIEATASTAPATLEEVLIELDGRATDDEPVAAPDRRSA